MPNSTGFQSIVGIDIANVLRLTKEEFFLIYYKMFMSSI